MGAIKFQLGAYQLVFTRRPGYPFSRPLEKVQVVDRSAAGDLHRESLGTSIRTRRLIFERMPKADYDGLVNWFDNIANGSEHEFTFTDERGDQMQVVFAQSVLDFEEVYFEQFSGELLLEVVG